MTFDRRTRVAALVFTTVAALTALHAQSGTTSTAAKKALSVDDYTRWRSINNPEISGDGNWVGYVLQLTNIVAAQAKPEVHIYQSADESRTSWCRTRPAPAFSPDSKWIAYQVDPARRTPRT